MRRPPSYLAFRSHVVRLVAVVAVLAFSSVVGATRVVVAAPGDVGSLSGVVQDASGTPVGGICVNVLNGPQATTALDGSYQVDGIDPGAHTVQFVDCNPTPTFVSSWYLGHQQQDQADIVTVTANTVVALAAVTLVEGVAVSGTVTGSSGAATGINVNVNPYAGGGLSVSATTAADGTYRTGPLPYGEYRVQFSDPTNALAGQYWQGSVTWNGATRLLLSVADGQERFGVDAVLLTAATISGTVTDSTGTGLADICVNANVADQGGFFNVGSGAITATDGTYTVVGVPPVGDSRVQFRDCSATPGHLEQWYNGAADFNSANVLSLSAGEQRSGIDARLADAGASRAGPFPRKLIEALEPELAGRLLVRAVGLAGGTPGRAQVSGSVSRLLRGDPRISEALGGLRLEADRRVVRLVRQTK